MEIIDLTLNKGKKSTIHGNVYSITYEIQEEDYYLKLVIDYFNKRLKVVNYDGKNYRGMAQRIDFIAKENSFDKVFIKATSDDWEEFMAYGYILEGIFKYYYNGEHGYCLSKFYTSSRRDSDTIEKENEIIEKLTNFKSNNDSVKLEKDYEIKIAKKEDIPKIVKLYDEVFKTYPIPLNNMNYVNTLMENDVLFMYIEHKGQIVSAASADMDTLHKNAEITDCATNNKHRGKGLMSIIINNLEKEMIKRDIVCLYSIARSVSFGMNKVFKKQGYSYTGRLINNCNICGKFEDMNLWVKKI
ncbi:putative beta-lysine N-acetyltransferase [Sporosalibacterium faouarense]|uniref:putative beta-lysine N-acetyltransferase n=1 Tax=Sporosalibacterium faouarense TaxID=516123 RepID=UPI00141C9F33|nr:putative beta-lysine N-acetyltransferase [Sporosalibacterium faouarense]MTI49780.1 putative beta-lysine N-acetyltransferase [Bacillota bacterium]